MKILELKMRARDARGIPYEFYIDADDYDLIREMGIETISGMRDFEMMARAIVTRQRGTSPKGKVRFLDRNWMNLRRSNLR